MTKSMLKKCILGGLILVTFIMLIVLVVAAIKYNEPKELVIPSNSVIQHYTSFGEESETIVYLPAKTLINDDSELNYSALLNQSYKLKNHTNEIYEYAKQINIKDYATFEDICVEIFCNALKTAKTDDKEVHVSLTLRWFDFYEEYDFSKVNEERLKFKCELLAQQVGKTTHGCVYLNEDYFSYNIY